MLHVIINEEEAQQRCEWHLLGVSYTTYLLTFSSISHHIHHLCPLTDSVYIPFDLHLVLLELFIDSLLVN